MSPKRASDPVEVLLYERELTSRIRDLHGRLNKALNAEGPDGKRFKRFLTEEFLGSASIMAKSLTEREGGPSAQQGGPSVLNRSALMSDARAHWSDRVSEREQVAEFRVISRCSIDLHIVASLWLELVGSLLDDALGSETLQSRGEAAPHQKTSAYGNRLRRTRSGAFNRDAPGSLKPYLYQYQHWQRSGHSVMDGALARGEKIVVLTTDVKSFFPSIDPNFLVANNLEFVREVCGVRLAGAQLPLHELFVEAMTRWRSLAAKHHGLRPSQVGLPIGVASSGVVANLALVELDQLIRNDVNPLYYGRYVDDLTLVLRTTSEMKTSDDVLNWLASKSTSLTGKLTVPAEDTDNALEFKSERLSGSVIAFSWSKTRVNFLEGKSGKFLLDSLRQADRERASEWRELPDLPETASFIAQEAVSLTNQEGANAETLQSAAQLTAGRATFALQLRNIEAYAKDIDPSTWVTHRTAFFDVVTQFVLAPALFFSLERYLARILQIALECRDWTALTRTVKAVAETYRVLHDTAGSQLSVELNGQALDAHEGVTVVEQWGARIHETIVKAIHRDSREGLPATTTENICGFLESVPLPEAATRGKRGPMQVLLADTLKVEQACSGDYYLDFYRADLAATPLRVSLLPGGWNAWQPTPKDLLANDYSLDVTKEGMSAANKRASALLSVLRNGQKLTSNDQQFGEAFVGFAGAAFPTRPPTLTEMYAASRLLSPDPAREGEDRCDAFQFHERVSLLRGYSIGSTSQPSYEYVWDQPDGQLYPLITVPFQNGADEGRLGARHVRSHVVRIALGMLETTRTQLARAIHGTPDLSRSRYAALIRLVNEVIGIESEVRPTLLVLPELSVPERWVQRIADKLKNAGVSLIAGVEYQRNPVDPTELRNQAWVSLAHHEWGFPANAVYVQDKRKPARGEERNLLAENQATLNPERIWETLPVFDHRMLRFSILICSELTNIETRASSRGRIDALIVPEWNSDTGTFGSIVESAAYDVHTFLVQANNRAHGDTRIRAPYKERWRRDVVRVSGGVRDSIIIGEIDIAALRKFQSRHDSGNFEFKPLPEGFKIDQARVWWQ